MRKTRPVIDEAALMKAVRYLVHSKSRPISLSELSAHTRRVDRGRLYSDVWELGQRGELQILGWRRYFISLPPEPHPSPEDLLYEFGRHIRNSENLSPIEYGVRGMDLLAKLREVDPEKYDREVKLTTPPTPPRRRR